ncbi:unnamed protein product [Rhizopus stolonifer]
MMIWIKRKKLPLFCKERKGTLVMTKNLRGLCRNILLSSSSEGLIMHTESPKSKSKLDIQVLKSIVITLFTLVLLYNTPTLVFHILKHLQDSFFSSSSSSSSFAFNPIVMGMIIGLYIYTLLSNRLVFFFMVCAQHYILTETYNSTPSSSNTYTRFIYLN